MPITMIEAVCKECRKPFRRAVNQCGTMKYCGIRCRGRGVSRARQAKRPVATCAVCGKVFKAHRSRLERSSHYYCSRGCYYLRHGHSKRLKRGTAGMQKLLTNSHCFDCGISEEYLLTVHHVDGNRSNNKPSNWEILCHNHHAKRHLKKRVSDGKWVYHPLSLTPRELLRSLP